MTRTKCPLVMIEWEDSTQPHSAWRFLEDVGTAVPVVCRSVGWLIGDGKTKVLAPNMGAIDLSSVQVAGTITIPARCVRRVVRLREPA